MSSSDFYIFFVKQPVDLVASFILLILLIPLFLLIGLSIFFHLGENPFFVQSRVGKDNKLFNLIKFRTFRKRDDFKSINKFGGFLRSSSLDELPQLINILFGDMSFVGPRPLLPHYLDYYTSEERKRHLVKPGLTGLAQIKHGNSPNWEKRMKCDTAYVTSISFWSDLKILIATVFHVINFKRKRSLDHFVEGFDQFAKKRS